MTYFKISCYRSQQGKHDMNHQYSNLQMDTNQRQYQSRRHDQVDNQKKYFGKTSKERSLVHFVEPRDEIRLFLHFVGSIVPRSAQKYPAGHDLQASFPEIFSSFQNFKLII